MTLLDELTMGLPYRDSHCRVSLAVVDNGSTPLIPSSSSVCRLRREACLAELYFYVMLDEVHYLASAMLSSLLC
jgi:hypothetical protein